MWLERLGETREPRALNACEQVGLDSAGEAKCVCECVPHLRSFRVSHVNDRWEREVARDRRPAEKACSGPGERVNRKGKEGSREIRPTGGQQHLDSSHDASVLFPEVVGTDWQEPDHQTLATAYIPHPTQFLHQGKKKARWPHCSPTNHPRRQFQTLIAGNVMAEEA